MERKEGRLGPMLLWSGSPEKARPKLAQGEGGGGVVGEDMQAGGQCEQWKTPEPSLAGSRSGEEDSTFTQRCDYLPSACDPQVSLPASCEC